MEHLKDVSDDPKIKFNDIGAEEWREYHFPDGYVVRIEAPLWLNVSKSGGHRIMTVAGDSEYIPPGWRRLRWRTRDGRAAFQF